MGKKKKRGKPQARNLAKKDVFHPMYGKLMEFDISKLNPYIQNGDLKRNIISDIVNDFNSELFKPIFVGELPDGTYWIYDGCHRTCGAELLQSKSSKKVIMGYLKKVSGMAEIAELYYQHNNIRPKTTFEKWRAHVERNNPPHVRMQDSLDKWNFRIGSGGKNNNIMSLTTLERIEEDYGIDIFDMTLQVLRLSFNGDAASLRKPFLLGLASFLYRSHNQPNFHLKNFISKLSKKNPRMELQNIEARGKKYDEVALPVFLAIYNFRLKDTGRELVINCVIS